MRVLLRDRRFGPYFAANLTSNSGTWFHNIAAAAVIYRATGSSLMVALVSILQFLSITLLAPVAGTLTDRFDRRRLLLASQLLCLVASVALVIGGVAVVDLTTRAGVPLILVVTAVIGIGTAVGTPAMQALVPNLVRGEQMETAVALNSVTFNLARVIGPALGGIVFASAGALPAFAVNGFSYLPLVIVLLVLDSPAQARPDRSERSLLTALRFVRADGVAAWLLLSLVALTLVGDPVFTLTPALADRFGQDAGAVGEQVAAFGLGSAVGLLALGRIRRRYPAHRVALGGLGVVAVGMAAVALSTVYLAALVSFLVAGAGFLIAGALLTASLHRRLPEELRGRVMALWGVAYLGTRPVGAAINGGMADLLGVVPAVAIAAVFGVVALALLAPRLWHEPPSA